MSPLSTTAIVVSVLIPTLCYSQQNANSALSSTDGFNPSSTAQSVPPLADDLLGTQTHETAAKERAAKFQNIYWTGTSGGASVEATVDQSGNIVVTGNGFEVTLSSNGEFISRTQSFNSTLSNIDYNALALIDIPPFSPEERWRGVVKTNPQNFTATHDGVPLPSGGLEGEALKAYEMCKLVADEKVLEGRLADQAAASPGAAMVNTELDKFLFERGVSAMDLENEKRRFIVEAQRKTERRENRYRNDWERQLYTTGASAAGPAEGMGELAGPWIANGAYGAATVGTATMLSGPMGAAAAGALISTAGTPVGGVGAKVGKGYGRVIDETGNNPFMPSPIPSNSPVPERSVIESLGVAFDKLMGGE